MITVGDIKQAIQPKAGRKTVIFRPCGEYSFVELNADTLNKAFDEINHKIPMVAAGICEFTAAENILFSLFLNHAEHG